MTMSLLISSQRCWAARVVLASLGITEDPGAGFGRHSYILDFLHATRNAWIRGSILRGRPHTQGGSNRPIAECQRSLFEPAVNGWAGLASGQWRRP
jgi:hypothetical protein